MGKRAKRKRRGHFESRVTKVESDRLTAAKEALHAEQEKHKPREPAFTVGKFGPIHSWSIEPVPNAIDLLRADQDSPPVVVR